MQNLTYYLEKEPEGCFLAEADGNTIGCIFSHVWGSVGWFGPVEVTTEHQNRGVGKELITKSVQYLKSRDCRTIGLETMSSSQKNIALYEKLGFAPRHLSYVLFKRFSEPNQVRSELRDMEVDTDLEDCKGQWDTIIQGLDYSTELQAVEIKRLGNVFVINTDGGPAHAVVHTYEMFDNSPNAIVKLLVSDDLQTASDLLAACENAALEAGKSGMFVRTYSTALPRLDFFRERGYALQSTSIRMILEGPDEAAGRIHISCWSG
jgi:N-acetylglutamate synthase-like GNAT family acetyltransferase